MKVKAKELRDQFLKFEKEHNAFDQSTFRNFFYWDTIRQEVYEAILGHYNLYYVTPVVPDKAFGWKNRLNFIWRTFQNELVFLFRKKKREVVFISVSRNINAEGFANDHLNQDYRDALSPDDYLQLELWYYAPFKPGARYDKRYFTYLMWFLRKAVGLVQKRIGPEFHRFIDSVEAFFGVPGVVNRQALRRQIALFYLDVQYYKWILKRVRPKVVIVSGCERNIAQACNELNIESVELQHGTFSSIFNLRYEYEPSLWQKNIKTIFPNFFTFSDYWSRIASLPTAVRSMGNSYLYNPVIPAEKKGRQVLIISNQDFTPVFQEPVKKLAKELPQFTFFYKMHSAEYEYRDSVVQFFEDCSNVTVILNERNVNDLLQVCDVMFTIQSTVSYQAIQQKVKVVLLTEKYYWISYDIFSLPNVFLVNDWEEFKDLLLDEKTEPDEAGPASFFDPFNAEAFQRFLKKEPDQPAAPARRDHAVPARNAGI